MDLISASEDCTVCIWDISSQRIIQKLDHKKGNNSIIELLAFFQFAIWLPSLWLLKIWKRFRVVHVVLETWSKIEMIVSREVNLVFSSLPYDGDAQTNNFPLQEFYLGSLNMHQIVVFCPLTGRITNLVAVPQSSLISTSNRKRVLNQFSVSPLDKYPQPDNLLKSTIPLFPSLQPLRENLNSIGFTSTGSLNQQILDTKVSLSFNLSTL